MASTYAYTTLAGLESHAALDYSAIYDGFTDDVVESIISDAEKWVNSHTGNTAGWTGTIPDRVELATKMVAKLMMNRLMIERGIHKLDQNPNIQRNWNENPDILALLNPYKDEYAEEDGIWISKHVHTARSGKGAAFPTGWE